MNKLDSRDELRVALEEAIRAKRAAERKNKGNGVYQPVKDVRLSDLEVAPIHWLWEYRIPLGMMTMLCGRKGVMKGLIAMWLASEVTKSGHTVLWCETEDPVRQVLKPRSIAAGAVQEKFIVKSPSEYKLIDDLGKYIEKRDIRLIIFSPLISFLKEVGDYNQEKQIRPELEKLQEAIEPYDCAIVGLGHLNKRSGGDQTAIERVMGSVAFVNFVRSLLIVAWDEEEDCPRLMHAAINLTSRDDDLLVELINKNEIGDGNERGPFVTVKLHQADGNVDADEALDRKRKGDKEETSGSQAEVLSWFNGETLSFTELAEKAKENDVKKNTLKTALRRLVENGDLEKPEYGYYRLPPEV